MNGNLLRIFFPAESKDWSYLCHLLSAEETEKLPVPVISVERAGGSFSQIYKDNFNGGKPTANHLIQNGYEVFIPINNDFREDWPSIKRIYEFE